MKYILKYLLCCFFLFVLNVSYSQHAKIDSLKKAITLCEIDSVKAELYFELGRQFEYFKSKERIEYFMDAAKLAKRINYSSGILKMYPVLITNLYHRGMNDVAMSYAIEYIQFLEKYHYQEDLYEFYNTYANLLCRQKKYKVARYYYDKSYNFNKSQKDYKQCANIFNNISILLLNTAQYDSALIYNSLAAQIYKANNDYSAYANSILGFAEITMKKGDLQLALQKAMEAYRIYEDAKIDLGMANSSIVLGEINYQLKDYKQALINYKTALDYAEKLNFQTIKRDVYLGVSKTYSGLNQFENAYQNQLLYKVMDDSISAEMLEGKMLEMEVKYDISKKESQIKESEYQLELKSKQQNQLLLLVLAGFIVLVFLLFAYRQKRKSNKEISEQKRLVDEKQKEIIDSINYARRIQQSNMSSEKYIDKTLKRLMK
ncbi:MAG: tetratricopeptide repeat protein [Bacteroidetes bacterium]|nr:tetratricopeptide repeat protein [Bacteroidota bacterium]